MYLSCTRFKGTPSLSTPAAPRLKRLVICGKTWGLCELHATNPNGGKWAGRGGGGAKRRERVEDAGALRKKAEAEYCVNESKEGVSSEARQSKQ